MGATTHFLTEYGYLVLMLWVFVEQIGIPLPAAPLLLAAGALAGAGHLSFWVSALAAIVAALLSDLIWYRVGRNRGNTVLGFLCSFSLQPDSCARRTQNVLSKHGASSLLVAKFVPWLNTAASPLAGAFGMRFFPFLLFDVLGVALWVGTFLGLGYLFSGQLENIAAYATRLGAVLFVVLLSAALITHLIRKYVQHQKSLEELRMARITVDELKGKLDSGEKVAIVDLRHPLDFLPEPYTIPGAIRFPLEELERHHEEIPRDRDVVLYCTCPNEASSAMAAMRLHQHGITRVRPLEGGYFAWRKAGFPLDSQFGLVPAIARTSQFRPPSGLCKLTSAATLTSSIVAETHSFPCTAVKPNAQQRIVSSE